MNENQTPNYIKALLIPTANKPTARKVWSIDLEAVWLPFFTATNVTGDSCIPSEALGAPIRLAYDPDGSVKFSKAGRPVTKVVKDLSDSIRLVRENFTAGLLSYAQAVITDRPEDYKAEIARASKAGEPIATKDKASLAKALKLQADKAVAEAEAIVKAAPPAAASPAAHPPKAETAPTVKGREKVGVGV